VKSKSRQEERPPCFDGLLWTINSIEMLYNQQKEQGYNYLLTNRLTSDVIENTFSVFRQRGGYNRYIKYILNIFLLIIIQFITLLFFRNPTARMFRTTFR